MAGDSVRTDRRLVRHISREKLIVQSGSLHGVLGFVTHVNKPLTPGQDHHKNNKSASTRVIFGSWTA